VDSKMRQEMTQFDDQARTLSRKENNIAPDQ
jgi:hypothetical protein